MILLFFMLDFRSQLEVCQTISWIKNLKVNGEPGVVLGSGPISLRKGRAYMWRETGKHQATWDYGVNIWPFSQQALGGRRGGRAAPSRLREGLRAPMVGTPSPLDSINGLSPRASQPRISTQEMAYPQTPHSLESLGGRQGDCWKIDYSNWPPPPG